jgi:GT2 family glycosyltransferase
MFSVVVPTYHRPDTLQKLLQSLEAQSFPKSLFEVIVVFTENDSSESVLKSFPSTFKLTPLKINDPVFNGKSASLKRNKGISAAHYPWIAFIDDDCIADMDWLKNANELISAKNPTAIEGFTQIPKDEKQTFTAKGLRHLSRFGGYQTCNMFYKKETLLAVGGFDPHLPFYLEDTDLAWSVLERNHSITPSETIKVTHPVPGSNVIRWLENAQRTKLIPYLAIKHPMLFKKKKFRALSVSSRLMVLLILILTVAALFGAINPFIGIVIYFFISSLYVLYLLRDCHTDAREVIQMLLLFPLVPPISAIQLLRGNLEYRTFII